MFPKHSIDALLQSTSNVSGIPRALRTYKLMGEKKLINYSGCLLNNYNILGADKPGDASKRGRKTKPKHKDGGSDSERKRKDTEAGLHLLSGQTASKATSSHTAKVSAPATCLPQETKSSGPAVAQSHAVKSLQSSSRTSWRSEMDKTSSNSSEEGNRRSTLVQSRLAWKTMASSAPTVDALKVRYTICITVPLFSKEQGK